MGTDITLIAEVHTDNGWKLAPGQPYDEGLFVWRHYEVWRALVGTIRPSDEPYVTIADEPRGLPNNICDQTRKIFNDSNCSTYSWITGPEFRFFFDNPARSILPLSVTMSHFAAACRYIMWGAPQAHADEKFRFVFGFDS